MTAKAYVDGLLRDACANVVARVADDRPSIPEPPDDDDNAPNEMDASPDEEFVPCWQQERDETDADDPCVGWSTCEVAHDVATAFVDAILASEQLYLRASPERCEELEPLLDPPTLQELRAPNDEPPSSGPIDEPCAEIEPPTTTPTVTDDAVPAMQASSSESGSATARDVTTAPLPVQAPSPVQVSSPLKAPKAIHKAGRPYPVAPSTTKPATTRTKRPMPPSIGLKQLTPPPSFASLDIYPQVLTDVSIFPASPRNDNQPDAFASACTKPPSMAKSSPKKLDPIVFRGGKYKAYFASGRSDASPRARRLKADAIVTTTRHHDGSPGPHHQVSGFCRQCLLYGDMRKLAECSEHNYFPPKSIA
ncbi:hypothetical protein SDRG_04929 [Saprolegnia diclina VS20]|uniref:Uncharacterized protein n=1 Tax=Saprolegnia diclina (strain VS20) TaxID=1156394 RepID=T0QT82_SAPDV|nr:hypothetical protein SDRG_04929 [Saprolegnia diclina VS20]EQC37911.1 hypothetical protein SDRG_04929 [Saprolegnia diclina VS20]|eukprot:XP_008608844.1 hypothetical protein SDRG_04929 [Saprolegnia diclina VS20]